MEAMIQDRAQQAIADLGSDEDCSDKLVGGLQRASASSRWCSVGLVSNDWVDALRASGIGKRKAAAAAKGIVRSILEGRESLAYGNEKRDLCKIRQRLRKERSPRR